MIQRTFNILSILSVLCLLSGCGETECQNGERICEDNVSKTCNGGLWTDVICQGSKPICDETYGCIGIKSTCGNGVIEGDEACDLTALAEKTCHDIFPGLVGTLSCTQDCTFDTSQCRIPECLSGSYRCQGQELLSCENGIWASSITCNDTQYCDPENKCLPIVCQESTRRCQNNTLEICVNHAYHTVMNCSDYGLKCDATSAACVQNNCSENEKQCFEQNGASSIRTCIHNAWFDVPCEPNQSCTKDIESGEFSCQTTVCRDGVHCGNNVLISCKYNLIISTLDCSKTNQICSEEQQQCL